VAVGDAELMPIQEGLKHQQRKQRRNKKSRKRGIRFLWELNSFKQFIGLVQFFRKQHFTCILVKAFFNWSQNVSLSYAL
jgi:hypothetical protein